MERRSLEKWNAQQQSLVSPSGVGKVAKLAFIIADLHPRIANCAEEIAVNPCVIPTLRPCLHARSITPRNFSFLEM